MKRKIKSKINSEFFIIGSGAIRIARAIPYALRIENGATTLNFTNWKEEIEKSQFHAMGRYWLWCVVVFFFAHTFILLSLNWMNKCCQFVGNVICREWRPMIQTRSEIERAAWQKCIWPFLSNNDHWMHAAFSHTHTHEFTSSSQFNYLFNNNNAYYKMASNKIEFIDRDVGSNNSFGHGIACTPASDSVFYTDVKSIGHTMQQSHNALIVNLIHWTYAVIYLDNITRWLRSGPANGKYG